MRFSRYLAMIVSLLLLCGCAAPAPQGQDVPAPRTLLADGGDAQQIERAAALVTPCVVGIAVKENGRLSGIGSGVIVHEKGYVLTNYHVAKPGSELTLIFEDGTQGEADLLWGDGALDLAVLRLRAEGDYPAAPLGSAREARVGEQVICVGTPLTLQFQHTVTHGIISALDRTLQVPSLGNESELSFMEGLIQTDASINPGNSGGPLVSLSGEVLGIISMKVDEAAGIGFAIPIDIAAPILRHFVENGSYDTPRLGLYAFDAEIARFLGQAVDMETGLYVLRTEDGSPAQRAGLLPGDVLLYADGRELSSMLDLRYAIYSHAAGELLRLEYMRQGRRQECSVLLASAQL